MKQELTMILIHEMFNNAEQLHVQHTIAYIYIILIFQVRV